MRVCVDLFLVLFSVPLVYVSVPLPTPQSLDYSVFFSKDFLDVDHF